MPDVTGGPVVTNASPFAVPTDLTALKDHFGQQNRYSVANAAALPASGNWLGRQLMAEDTKWRYQCTALPGTWSLISTPASTASLSMGGGYSLTSGGVYLHDLFVVVALTVTKSSAIAHNDTVFTVPVGHRPAVLTVATGRLHGFANYNTGHIEVSTTGVVKVFFNGANSETILSLNMVYLRA